MGDQRLRYGLPQLVRPWRPECIRGRGPWPPDLAMLADPAAYGRAVLRVGAAPLAEGPPRRPAPGRPSPRDR